MTKSAPSSAAPRSVVVANVALAPMASLSLCASASIFGSGAGSMSSRTRCIRPARGCEEVGHELRRPLVAATADDRHLSPHAATVPFASARHLVVRRRGCRRQAGPGPSPRRGRRRRHRARARCQLTCKAAAHARSSASPLVPQLAARLTLRPASPPGHRTRRTRPWPPRPPGDHGTRTPGAPAPPGPRPRRRHRAGPRRRGGACRRATLAARDDPHRSRPGHARAWRAAA